VTIEGDRFLIDGRPTYEGREHQGSRIEGLLMNSRMVQATFDDENPDTRHQWAYPDTNVWDADRNLREFLAAMPEWRAHGLLAVTLCLQGGCPQGYCKEQPWINSAIAPDGGLKPGYIERLARIVERADELGMVVILGLYYFGQDERVRDEAAVVAGVDNAVGWLLARGSGNVAIEVANEVDVPRYEHEILQPHRIHELVERVRDTERDGRRLLVGVSYRGGSIPSNEVVAASDFILLHGNGVTEPEEIGRMVERTRALPAYRPMPILFNEDDNFDFDRPDNNMMAAVRAYASWGYYDGGPGSGGHHAESDYVEGYQNVPVNWGINTPVKRSFFDKVREVTGA
jgi:hypothetical protein